MCYGCTERISQTLWAGYFLLASFRRVPAPFKLVTSKSCESLATSGSRPAVATKKQIWLFHSDRNIASAPKTHVSLGMFDQHHMIV